MELNPDFWRRCSSCKNPIKYSANYYVCSVSTCNRKRIGYVFDSVHCWERHLPGARHKDAAAVEAKAPTFEQWKAELGDDAVAPGGAASALSATGARAPLTPEQQAAAVAAARSGSSGASTSPSAGASGDVRTPQRVIMRSPSASPAATPQYKDALESEILVVVSKMKGYVKERADMNTSDSVSQLLSNRLRRLLDRAIENARADGRKTIMDRDFER